MARRAIRSVFFCALVVVGVAQTVQAGTVTVHFTAEITEITTSDALEELDEDLRKVAESFEVGDLVEGVYAYDTPLPDYFDNHDFEGLYQTHARPCGITVNANGFVLQTDPEAVDVTIQVLNDLTPSASHLPREKFSVASGNNLMSPPIGDLRPQTPSLELEAFWPSDPLIDDSLPGSAPTLEDWDIRRLEFGFERGSTPARGAGEGSYESVSFIATVTSVELLPDPAYVFHAKADAMADDACDTVVTDSLEQTADRAGTVTVHFTAEITEITSSDELEELGEDFKQVAESFQIGDLVGGCYAYDMNLEDVVDFSEYRGVYWAEAPPTGIVVYANGFTFQTDPDSERYFVQINTKDSDGVGSHASHATVEEFTITSSANTMTPVVGDLQSSRISLEFGAFWPGDPLSGDSLPLTAPVLEDWDIRTLGFGMWRGGRGASESVLFTATVTSVELLPDPAYVFYAKADADSGGDGLSWSTAYSSLQDAIAGVPTVGSSLIRVAQGTYRPDLGQGFVTGDCNAAFELPGGLTIQGGYAGLEAYPLRRDPILYPTVLDGDLGEGNALHVVVAEKAGQTACLDGCIIRGGYARAIGTTDSSATSEVVDSNACGGGLLLIDADPIIRQCIFQDNIASQHGGAVCCLDRNPQFVDCRFEDNNAGKGGAIYARSNGVIGTRCVLAGNTANTGGAVAVLGTGQWDHCTFNGNQADLGSSLACLDSNGSTGASILSHCILRDGDSGICIAGLGDVAISYSNIQGGWPGLGNIDVDPLFADPKGYDFHLKSQAGRWDPAGETWVQDDVTSPCIDAGNPNSPVMYEPFPNGGIINMGAYGGTGEASKSYF